MLSSFFLMRCRRRSSGPSKFSSRIGSASGDDSKSWAGSVTKYSPLSIRDLDRVAHPRHGLLGHAPRASRTFEEDLFQLVRPGVRGSAPLANGLEMRVQRVGQLSLHFHVAHLA